MRLLALFASAAVLAAQSPAMFEQHLEAGRSAAQQSRYAEAERQYRLALDDPDSGERITEALEALCDLDLLVGKYPDAIELQERAVLEIHDDAKLPPHLVRLAGAYRAGSKAILAEPVLLRAIALDVAAAGPDSARVTADYDVLASTYSELFRYSDARATLKEALAARTRRLGPDDVELATNLVNMGVLEERDAKPLAAKPLYEKALAISEKKFGPESYSITGILDRIGLLLRGTKNFSEAEPVLQRSLSIREKTLGPRHSDVAPALDNLAVTYFFDSKFTDAEPLYTRSLQIWLATQGNNSPLVAQALDNLGALYSAQQKYEQAEPFFRRAIAIRERQDIESLANMALILAVKKDLKGADECFSRALLIGEKGFGGEHPEIVEVMDQYVIFLRTANRPLDAKKVEARAKDLRERAARPLP